MRRNHRHHIIRAFLLPWLIAGAIGAAVLAGAAATRGNGNAAKGDNDDVPELVIIPELVMVEPCDPDGDPNAP